MKTVLVTLVIFLTGCASLAFDPVEYDRFVTIATTAELGKSVCSTPLNVPQITNHLAVLAKLAVNNAKYRNKKAEEKMATEIFDMAIELQSKYGKNENFAFVASKTYCETKMTNISDAAVIAAKATGGKK